MVRTSEAPRGRRDFLKVAGGVAAAFATIKDTYGQAGSGSRAETATPTAQSRPNRQDQPMDRGLWISWYDLPDDGRQAYLSWLHETYIPGLLKRPGYLWAAHYASQEREVSTSSQFKHIDDPSVPTGYRYILLIGAKDSHVFGSPVPSALHAKLPEQSRKMLAMRIGERVNIMVEAGRCQGPKAKVYKGGMTGAPCIQIGSFNCPVEYEEEMHAGYVQQRLPAMCESPSCIRTRKLNSAVGWAKHGILYEFASLEGFNRDYPAAIARSPLGVGRHSVVPMLIHAPNGPNSALRMWPPVSKA